MQKYVWLMIAFLAFSAPVKAQELLPERGPVVETEALVPRLDLSLEQVLTERAEVLLRPQVQGVEKIQILLNGQPVKELPAAEANQPLRLSVPTQKGLRIQLRGEAGEKQFQSQPIILDTAQYAPQPMQISLKSNQVVGNHLPTLTLQAQTPQQGYLEVTLDGQSIYGSRFYGKQETLPRLALNPGRHQLQLRLTNAWGQYQSPPVQVFNFGVEPPASTFILVDKFNFTLYWVKEGVLNEIFPIAIGRPKTPTIPGYWLLGQKEVMPNPNTSWGVKRLKIYREKEYQKHWSGYAIHGTNRPSSIGTEASHGCVRMFNEDVTRLFEQVPLKTPVLIEEKLKVYIDEIESSQADKSPQT